jgi:hypothetical protein
MGSYSKFISEKRRSQAAPKSLVQDGQAVFGTFDKEIENINLTEASHPTKRSNKANLKKLTRWEAFEVHVKNGYLVCGVCNMGYFSTVCTVFYDNETGKVHAWDRNYGVKAALIAPNLLNGTKTEISKKKDKVSIINNYEKDEAFIQGDCFSKKAGHIVFSFKLKRISLPSCVCIPFGPNRPLYTQKDLFKAEGKLTMDGKEFVSDEQSVAIIDDHKGYYPYHAHYDWITELGPNKFGQLMGINLTQNQSIDPYNYNENLIWTPGHISLLPPVEFAKDGLSKKFKNEKDTPLTWTIKDAHGMVDLKCHIKGMFKTTPHLGILNLDYFITFGVLEGTVKDENGNICPLDGQIFIGEDKTIKF